MIDSIRNTQCNKCSLAGICQTVCIMGSGNIKSKVMFVAEAPTNAEDKEGTTFSSVKYDLLWKILDKALGKKSEDYYYTTLVKCTPSEGRYIEQDEIDNCRSYLEAEINAIKPTVIITFGNIAMEALTGEKGITTKRGTLMSYLKDKSIAVIPTYSPQYVERRMKSSKIALEHFAKDINKGLLASDGLLDKKELTKVKVCSTMEEVYQLIYHVHSTGVAVLDFETTGLDYKIDKPTILGISFQIGSGWVIPLYHFESPFSEKEVLEIMHVLRVEIWENEAIRKVGQNFKFDMHFANAYTEGGITPVNCEDIINMHHILDENSRHGLKVVAPMYFPDFDGYEDEVGKYKWAEVPLDILSAYCVVDTDLTMRLCLAYELELMKYPELYRLYRSFANPALKWTFTAEKEGMLIDHEYLSESIELVSGMIDEKEKAIRGCTEILAFDKYKREEADEKLINILEEKLEKARARAKNGANKNTANYEERIRNIKAGNRDKDSFDKINFGSPKQLGELLYGECGFNFEMPYDRKKRAKAPSTEKKYLDELDDTSGFIKNLQEWRRMSKLLSTYFKGIMDRLDINNRLHTDFLIFGTTTGRFSSRNPNLQNIPRKGNDSISEIAKRVKNCFIAPEGYTVMQADYSQAELRLVAEYAKEDTMIEAYNNDKDLHALTAMTIKRMTEKDFNALEDNERSDERFKAKAANFGFIYGMEADSYQDYKKQEYKIESTYEECVKERHLYFTLYSKLQRWHKRQVSEAKENGYVSTLFGRRRRLVDINDSDGFIRSLAERQAINAPIQGSGGEYTGFSAAILELRLEVFDTRIKIVNSVHDSLIFYIPDGILEEAKVLIRDTMENPPVKEYFDFELEYVSMKVDCETGTSWGTLK